VTAGDRSDELQDIRLLAFLAMRRIGEKKVCVYDIVNEYKWPSTWSAAVTPAETSQSGWGKDGYTMGGTFIADDEAPFINPPDPELDEISKAAVVYEPNTINCQQAFSAVGWDGGDSKTYTKYDPMSGRIHTSAAELETDTVPQSAFGGRADLQYDVAMLANGFVRLRKASGTGCSGNVTLTGTWRIFSTSWTLAWTCTVTSNVQYAFRVDGVPDSIATLSWQRTFDDVGINGTNREWSETEPVAYRTGRSGTGIPVTMPVGTEICAGTKKYDQDSPGVQHGESKVTVLDVSADWAPAYPRIVCHYP
jgi:hypothetical protein